MSLDLVIQSLGGALITLLDGDAPARDEAIRGVLDERDLTERDIVAELCPGFFDHHQRIASSRSAWIKAATSVLGPAWDGTPEQLRDALLAALAEPQARLEAVREELDAMLAAQERERLAEARKPRVGDVWEWGSHPCTVVEVRRETLENERGRAFFATAVVRPHHEYGIEHVVPQADMVFPEWKFVSRKEVG